MTQGQKPVRRLFYGPTEGTRIVVLTRERLTVIDEVDAEWAGEWNWSFDGEYAARNHGGRVSRQKIRLHREIAARAGLAIEGFQVDHRDGDYLNNRRSNLRIASHSDNARNIKMPVTNTSGFKGVSSKRGRWRARIRMYGYQVQLGTFDSREEASSAYEVAAAEVFQDFKRPMELY